MPAGASKAAGSSIAGALDSLGNVLKQPQDQTPKVEAVTRAQPATKAPASASKSYQDAAGIEKGMTCEEVARRFGPPTMAFATEDGRTMSYAGKAGRIQVECQGGKVASVEKPH